MIRICTLNGINSSLNLAAIALYIHFSVSGFDDLIVEINHCLAKLFLIHKIRTNDVDIRAVFVTMLKRMNWCGLQALTFK